MKRPIIIFSTITGNAYKLACAAAKGMEGDYLGPYNIRYINDEVIEKFNTFILCYWCNHGTADDDTIELIRKLKGKNLILLGSLGVSVDTAHAKSVTERVVALAKEENNLLAHYLCQGSIDLKRTFERTKIPEGEKGHLSLERYEKQKLSLGHPDENELKGAEEAVRIALRGAYE
jgi:flavodoxin